MARRNEAVRAFMKLEWCLRNPARAGMMWDSYAEFESDVHAIYEVLEDVNDVIKPSLEELARRTAR